MDTPTWTPTSMEAWHSTDWSKIGLRSMPASSTMMSFDDCETDGLSSSSCIYNLFYYNTIRKSSIYSYSNYKCITKMYYLLINFITCNYDFFLLIINVCHTRALSLFSTAFQLLSSCESSIQLLLASCENSRSAPTRNPLPLRSPRRQQKERWLIRRLELVF